MQSHHCFLVCLLHPILPAFLHSCKVTAKCFSLCDITSFANSWTQSEAFDCRPPGFRIHFWGCQIRLTNQVSSHIMTFCWISKLALPWRRKSSPAIKAPCFSFNLWMICRCRPQTDTIVHALRRIQVWTEFSQICQSSCFSGVCAAKRWHPAWGKII